MTRTPKISLARPQPYRECVLTFGPDATYVATQPDLPPACVELGDRALLLPNVAACCGGMGVFGLFHLLLVANGLTTIELYRRGRSVGALRSLVDLLLLRCEAHCDKWAMLFGSRGTSTWHKVRILTLPSLPHARGARGWTAIGTHETMGHDHDRTAAARPDVRRT